MDTQYTIRQNLALFITATIAGFVSVLFLYKGLPVEIFFLLIGFTICLVSMISFETAQFFFLTLIFLPYIYALRIHPSAIYTLFLFISALFSLKNGMLQKAKNPLWFPLFFYFITTLPSLVNTPRLILSIRDMSNQLALFLIFFVSLNAFDSADKIRKIFYFFIAAVFLHSLYVVYLGITVDRRAFGLLGVYYIDFAALAGLLTFILVLYLRGVKRIIASIIFAISTLGLILTQTRNAWISFAFAIVTLMIYLIFKGESFYIKRRTITRILVFSVLLIASVFIFAGSVNTKLESRVDLANESVVNDDPVSIGANSLASRVLIWYTAGLAFLQHPYIGIGSYSFKHTSDLYYKIPKGFFKLYVEGRTPHVTYLQVLTETGILGMMGFLFFIFSLIREMRKLLSVEKSKEEITLTLMIAWSFVYIIFSMFMTESWLYGQYIVWIGVLLGFLINFQRILNAKSKVN